MLKGFGNFLLKELKELIRDPKILLGFIVVPLIMFPVLGGIISFSMESVQESASKTTALVLNRDSGENSTDFIVNYLNSSLRAFVVDVSAIEEAVSLLPKYNATEIVEIPAGFSQNVSVGRPVHVEFFSVYTGAGLVEGIGSSIIDAVVQQYNRAVAPDMIVPRKSVIIKGEVVEGIDARTLSGLMISQAVALPITMMILLTYSMQIAATSVAMEKEEKTLETLLTLPMDRFVILAGKLSGSIIVAGIGAIAYMVGFTYYFGSFSGMLPAGTSVDLVSLGLVPSAFGYLLLGLSLFVALLSALALAVILSAFAEDVRGAQSLVSYVYPLLFIPSFVLMYLDINVLPFWLRLVLYAIPYSHPIIASRAVIMGDFWTVGLGIAYVSVFTVAIMYVASRLFATEKILTAKLKFKGLRKRKATPVE